MRTQAFLLLLMFSLPALASKQVTVAQLEQTATELGEKPDADAAQHLSDLRLTERLSARRLAVLVRAMPGEKSRTALLVLADESAYLEPPSSGVPPNLPPDLSEQRRVMGLVVAYVTRAIPKLPDFLATRTMVRFEDQPLGLWESSQKMGYFTEGSAGGDPNRRANREATSERKGACGCGRRKHRSHRYVDHRCVGIGEEAMMPLSEGVVSLLRSAQTRSLTTAFTSCSGPDPRR